MRTRINRVWGLGTAFSRLDGLVTRQIALPTRATAEILVKGPRVQEAGRPGSAAAAQRPGMARRVKGGCACEVKTKGPCCAQRGAAGRRLDVAVLIAVLGVLVLGIEAAAQFGTVEVRILPEYSVEGSPIVLVVSGTGADSCVPRLDDVRIAAKHIVVATESPAMGCTSTPTPWSVLVPLEELPAGPYAVTITYRRTGGPYEMPEQVIGRATFQVTMPGCAAGDSIPEASPADLTTLVQGNAAFALDLYGTLRTNKDLVGKNLFFSPYGISLCLAMAYAGARGETERQMAETLRFTLPQDRLHPAFAQLSLTLAGRNGLELSIANSLWGQTGYPFLPSFLCLLGEVYGAPLQELDFLADPEAARRTINRWVEEETRGRIQDLIPPMGITEETRLVLANAVYFKAAWLFPFPEGATRDAPFHLLDRREVLVPTMVVQAPLDYFAGDGYQAVELPYNGGEASLVILLPDPGCFEEFEQSLDTERLTQCLERLEKKDVLLFLPKFTFTSEFSLGEILAGLGMPDAFSDQADFSGMTGRRDLVIDDVYHKAFVGLDEAGTEAAAATAVVMVMGLPPKPPVEVRVDRPFLFLIRDQETGTILFLGRVLNPAR